MIWVILTIVMVPLVMLELGMILWFARHYQRRAERAEAERGGR